jgi:putative ABC transport system ATP-binding protein
VNDGISADKISVRYGELVAVAEVSLHVPRGAMVAVSGPSGAGKSSLLWAIAGARLPSDGIVLVDGEPVGDRSAAGARGVVLIPQGNGLARMLTARENITVPLLANPGGSDDFVDADEAADELAGRVDQALADVGLEESGNHLVEELSGGEQQRVAVARGLAQRGTVILADESTSELDGTNRERVVRLLRAEARRGAAVLIATHDPDVAAEADGHALLDDGRLTWQRSLY